MSKIKTIQVENLKSISFEKLELNGASIIVTGKNDSGKSTLLRSIIDRIRGEKPELIVKQGEKRGMAYLELDTNEKFEWKFEEGKEDKLTFITDKGIRVASSKAINERFFPPAFDINAWMAAPPKKQSAMLQALVGLDFTKIDAEYDAAYKHRTFCNAEFNKAIALLNAVPTESMEPVEEVDISILTAEQEALRAALNQQYLENKKQNDLLRDQYKEQSKKNEDDVRTFNKNIDQMHADVQKAETALTILKEYGYAGKEVDKWLSDKTAAIPIWKSFDPLPEPEYIQELPDDSELVAIGLKIAEAAKTNQLAQGYRKYLEMLNAKDAAQVAAQQADLAVKEIQERKEDMIKNTVLPEGIEFTDNGISINGLPLDESQISSSLKAITGLRLAVLNLGEVNAVYFDASFLDRDNYNHIQKWADENNLQLLVERPDWDGGPLRYEFILSSNQ